MKICLGSWVVSCRQTDVGELIVTFRHLANAPKEWLTFKSKWKLGNMYLLTCSIADVTCHPRCQPFLLALAFLFIYKKYRCYTEIVEFSVVGRAAKTFENPCCRHDLRGSCLRSSLDRDTGYHDIFRNFLSFFPTGLSRLEQGRWFKIHSNS
jgi:hypothetical protein